MTSYSLLKQQLAEKIKKLSETKKQVKSESALKKEKADNEEELSQHSKEQSISLNS